MERVLAHNMCVLNMSFCCFCLFLIVLLPSCKYFDAQKQCGKINIFKNTLSYLLAGMWNVLLSIIKSHFNNNTTFAERRRREHKEMCNNDRTVIHKIHTQTILQHKECTIKKNGIRRREGDYKIYCNVLCVFAARK